MNSIDNSGTVSFCIHAGASMNPTLYEPDLLEIVHYDEQAVRTGDVIVFRSPEEDHLIVHRVVSITSEGVRTRGDNNANNDPWLLQPTNITGRVAAAWRGQKRRRIIEGRTGWLVAHLTRWSHIPVRYLFLPLLRPIYRFLLRLGVVYCLWPNWYSPRIVLFQKNGHSHLRLLLGKRVVGWYNVRQCQWHIKHPFRLFVNLKNFENLAGF
jgi:signal peptidase I